MEKIPQRPKTPESPERSVLSKSEVQTKRMTSEGAPENIDADFTVETYSKFDPNEIAHGDRAYVYTQSGNVYRIDRSQSRPKLLKFFNQNKGNAVEYTAPAPGKSKMIEVGKEMFYGIWNDPDDFSKGGRVANSTSVNKIEVWRNYLKAIDEIEAELKAKHPNGRSMGAMIVNATNTTVSHKDYTKKKV